MCRGWRCCSASSGWRSRRSSRRSSPAATPRFRTSGRAVPAAVSALFAGVRDATRREDEARGVGRLMRRLVAHRRHADDRGGRRRARLGVHGLEVGGPVHGDAELLRPASARAELRPAARGRETGRRDRIRRRRARRTLPRDAVELAQEPEAWRCGRAAAHPAPRSERDRRQRHRPRHAQARARPLPGVGDAGRGRARLHRGPPDDLRRAVLEDRQAAEGRPRLPRAAVRDVRVRDHRPPDRRARPRRPCSKSKGHELLALQACHPRFFASHRYIAYAKPIAVSAPGDKPTPLETAGWSSRAGGSGRARRLGARLRRPERARARRPPRRGRSCATPGR